MKKYIFKRKIKLILTVLALTISLVASALTTVKEQQLIDKLVSGEAEGLHENFIVLLLLTFFAVGVYVLSDSMAEVFRADIISDMRMKAVRGIVNANTSENLNDVEDGLSIITNDLPIINQRYLGYLFMTISEFIGMVTSFVIMFIYQPIIATTVIVMAGIIIVIPKLAGEKQSQLQEKKAERNSVITKMICDVIQGIGIICNLGVSNIFLNRIKKKNDELTEIEKASGIYTSVVGGILQFVGTLTGVAIMGLSAYFVINGRMTIGQMAVFASLQSNFSSSLQMAFRTIPIMSGVTPLVKRIDKLAEMGNCESVVAVKSFDKSIELKNVCVGYDSFSLNDINLCISKGSKNIVLGDNGSGKSTLIKCLCGYIPKKKGSIEIDGVAVDEDSHDGLGQLVAVVEQDIFLFNDTIEFNILLGEKFASEAYERALKTSGVGSFIYNLEDGVNYIVGENGCNLSGGQKQKIVIARELIRERPILILDEGFSTIDSDSSKEIETALLKDKRITLISISHDNTYEHLTKYDQVIRISNGSIESEYLPGDTK